MKYFRRSCNTGEFETLFQLPLATRRVWKVEAAWQLGSWYSNAMDVLLVVAWSHHYLDGRA